MNIEQLTLKDLREIASLFQVGVRELSVRKHHHPYVIGGNYFIRTVTHHYTGVLVEVYDTELVLEKAAWVADDGRFAQAVASAEFAEVEPFPSHAKVILGRSGILDAVIIATVPTSQK